MATRRILQLGDPLLREVSTPVASAVEVQPLLRDLADTLHEFQRNHGFGRGISAVQIGALQRVIYIEIEGRSYSLVNAQFTYLSSDTFTLWDDCFSFPDLLVKLQRSTMVELAYEDATGRPETLRATGAFAELLQHELDHLDGILAIDRALDRNSLITRLEYDRQRLNLCGVIPLQEVRRNSGGSVR